MAKNNIEDMASFLFETGLLFEINRRILNPYGLNLIVTINEDDEVSLGPLLDHREEEAGIIMSNDLFDDGLLRFKNFLDKFGAEKLNNRIKELGFIEQNGPDQSDLDKFSSAINAMDVKD